MHFIGIIIIIVQILLLIHAIKSGRNNWIWILFVFPGVGSIVYFIVEYLPSMRQRALPKSDINHITMKVFPAKELQKLKDQVELNNCFNNRVNLAEGYLLAGMPDDAISLFKDCLKGRYENDPDLLTGLAKAHFQKKNYTESITALDTIFAVQKSPKHQIGLLYAEVLEESGQLEMAIVKYNDILKTSVGEETRYRLALLYMKVGKEEDAKCLFEIIVRNARLSPQYYRHSERKWIRKAKYALKTGIKQ